MSLTVHAFGSALVQRFGRLDFGRPLSTPATVMVELNQPDNTTTPNRPKLIPVTAQTSANVTPLTSYQPTSPRTQLEPLYTPDPQQGTTDSQLSTSVTAATSQDKPLQLRPVTTPTPSEIRFIDGNDIVAAQQEKLVYQLRLGAMPIGSAQLEASNNNGEVRIQSSVRSNSVVSAFYQVNDSTDTRLIKGRYLLTRIRQHEGTNISDTGFNLMYPERRIFWVDRINNRYNNEPLDTTDTLDFVTGLYFLRQQSLIVGENRTLRLYDGDTTTLVSVSVLRVEIIQTQSLKAVETIVVQPQFAASGFFRNNRDLVIWFTNDDNRVPIRMEATTPLGRITAEIVSAERSVTSN